MKLARMIRKMLGRNKGYRPPRVKDVQVAVV